FRPSARGPFRPFARVRHCRQCGCVTAFRAERQGRRRLTRCPAASTAPVTNAAPMPISRPLGPDSDAPPTPPCTPRVGAAEDGVAGAVVTGAVVAGGVRVGGAD